MRIGGLGIFISVIISFIITLFLFNKNIEFIQFKIFQLLFFGSTIVFIIGFIDDKANISPFLRLISQAIIVFAIWLYGFGVESFTLFDKSNIIYLPQLLSFFISFLWLSGVANAINWTDGIDGLATSVTGSSAIFITLINIHNNQILVAVLSSILGGILFISVVGIQADDFVKPVTRTLDLVGAPFLVAALLLANLLYFKI